MALHLQVKDIDAHWKRLNELGFPLPADAVARMLSARRRAGAVT